MNTLLLVDGSNIVMRAAFGGELTPAQAVPIATGLVRKAAFQSKATHLVIALDSPDPSWRKREYPEYKAHRNTDTTPWLRAAHEAWAAAGWYVEDCGGFEADDIIATVASRAGGRSAVVAVSGDSDLQPLTSLPGVRVLKPENGGKFTFVSSEDVCRHWGISSPARLTDFKALTGESGDNIPGVPGIGPKRATALLASYGPLESIIAAGAERKCRHSETVAQHGPEATRWKRLLTLSFDAPIAPIHPVNCIFKP